MTSGMLWYIFRATKCLFAVKRNVGLCFPDVREQQGQATLEGQEQRVTTRQAGSVTSPTRSQEV